MEEQIRELLNKVGTQIDGVESYLRQLRQIGNEPEFCQPDNELGRALRVFSEVEIDLSIDSLRRSMQKIEDELNSSLEGNSKD